MTKQERTQKVIDGFKGLPEEFGMLKGLLCLDGQLGIDSKIIPTHLDRIMIASRMDEIIKGIIADAGVAS